MQEKCNILEHAMNLTHFVCICNVSIERRFGFLRQKLNTSRNNVLGVIYMPLKLIIHCHFGHRVIYSDISSLDKFMSRFYV